MNDRRLVRRRVGAVLAGFLAVVILSTVADVVVHATGVFPPWGEPMADRLFLIASAYRAVFTVAGGYITARLAPDRPMTHVLALGVIGIVAGTAGTVATWNAGPAFGPRWYPLSLIATAIPCVWAGGRLFGLQHPESVASAPVRS